MQARGRDHEETGYRFVQHSLFTEMEPERIGQRVAHYGIGCEISQQRCYLSFPSPQRWVVWMLNEREGERTVLSCEPARQKGLPVRMIRTAPAMEYKHSLTHLLSPPCLSRRPHLYSPVPYRKIFRRFRVYRRRTLRNCSLPA